MSSSWQDKIIVANQFVLSGIFLIWQGSFPPPMIVVLFKGKGKFIYIAHFSNMATQKCFTSSEQQHETNTVTLKTKSCETKLREIKLDKGKGVSCQPTIHMLCLGRPCMFSKHNSQQPDFFFFNIRDFEVLSFSVAHFTSFEIRLKPLPTATVQIKGRLQSHAVVI